MEFGLGLPVVHLVDPDLIDMIVGNDGPGEEIANTGGNLFFAHAVGKLDILAEQGQKGLGVFLLGIEGKLANGFFDLFPVGFHQEIAQKEETGDNRAGQESEGIGTFAQENPGQNQDEFNQDGDYNPPGWIVKKIVAHRSYPCF
ncbi:MAG: hypothetical protein BWY71_00942 [Planctomycetes bacterium ADurb.Bin412]|nr:MAG: hypothetical protein BWY71_00942 [Planctomycetes bacterium ADurb.Bin412]